MNVTALARTLKMTTAELLKKLPQLGFDIGSRAIKIDERVAEKIIKTFEELRKKEQALASQRNVKEIKLDKEKVIAEKKVKLPETIIVRELSEKLNVPLVKVMAHLMKNGVIVSLNEKIDYETAAIISEDLGYQVEKASPDELISPDEGEGKKRLKESLIQEKADLQVKPPVVVMMGHVDHGKTKLLDAIRKTNVMGQESGGITQHIGAYQVMVKDRLITFLDTPGHEAFKNMRSRGSKIADLAIVVVAADEGLKPQTIEVLELVQKEKLPFIIAINKIDKEGADIERVKKELSELNIVPEDWGGKTICVPISAKAGQGIKELLEMVNLVADMTELKANPKRSALGTIIESHIDKGEGPVATVIISTGTLKIGDYVEIGRIIGKIRTMRDWQGKVISQATPSMPAKILGLKCATTVGDALAVITDKKMLKQKIKECRFIKVKPLIKIKKEEADEQQKNFYPIILKTDVLGSQEAIMEALDKIPVNEARIKIIKKGLGTITEIDILDALSAKATIVGFHVKVTPSVEKLAKEKNVEIKLYDVIYKLLEESEDKLKELIKPDLVRVELGRVKALKIFRSTKDGQIVGGKVEAGKIINQTKIKVLRNDQLIGFVDLVQLQSGRQDTSEVIIGQECGLKTSGKPIIQTGDVLEIYQEQI